jgi:iron complex transport system ATP-binding protein
MSLLACDDLHIQVGQRRLLEGIRLALQPGELLGILGTNGAGKTTLLRALVGLVAPSQGQVTLGGQAVHWPLPGRAVVALGRLPFGDAQQASGREAVAHAMQATDTLAFADTPVHQLSGGERARVLLARVLVGNPAVLLADEPLAALDPSHQLRMMALLQRQAQAGRAIAVVLHDLALAARFCSRVIVLHQGRLLTDGAPAVVLDDPILARAFGVEAVRVQHAGQTCLVPWRLVSSAMASVIDVQNDRLEKVIL